MAVPTLVSGGWAQRWRTPFGSRPPRCGFRLPAMRLLSCISAVFLVNGCATRVHLLGYDDNTSTADGSETSHVSNTTNFTESAAPLDASLVLRDAEPTADADAADGGQALPTPVNPPNILVDELGLDPTAVSTRLTALFERLFVSGNADSEMLYYELDDQNAFVLDVLHDDSRMDAMGYGMLLTVQFDHPDRFARLWSTVKTHFRYESGPRRGYFRFSCKKDFSECSDVLDSFGSFYVVTALFMAAERWGDDTYRAEALDVLAAMRDKEVDGAATEGVLNLFTEVGIPRQVPLVEGAGTVSPVALLPAFFEFWYVQTTDAFWHQAANSSRRLLLAIPHPETGLTPDVVTEAGEPVENPALFREESYPAAFQLALDAAWFPRGPEATDEYARSVNRLLGFFYRQSPTNYVALYQIDGTVTEDKTSMALVALNGAAAAVATLPSRQSFLQGAWETTGPSGVYRFYDGVYQLLSLTFLGGQLRVTF